MQKKSPAQKCERLRDLDVADLPVRCAEFARHHADAIAKARPQIPTGLSDRAADIWEPLLVLADLTEGRDDVPVVPNLGPQTSPEPLSTFQPINLSTGPDWPSLARQAAVSLAGTAQEQRPIVALLSDIQKIFTAANTDRLFTRTIVQALDELPDRPWRDPGQSNRITSLWLSGQLRPYGIASKTMWINGKAAKGYDYEDFKELFRRYLSKH